MVRNYVPRKLKPRRPHRVSVWTSDDEKSLIESAATVEGETVSQFIRTSVIGSANAVLVEEFNRTRGESA